MNAQTLLRLGKELLFPRNARFPDSTVADSSRIHPRAKIICSVLAGPVSVGEGALIDHAYLKGPISIGRYSSFNGPNSDIYALHNPVSIGSFCSIARNVSIQEYNHVTSRCTSYFILHHLFGEDWRQETNSKGPIVIGNDIWIGAGCVVLSGTKIGDGAVVAANSVVARDVPPYAIVAGSPATVVRYRFPETLIERMLALKWWEWDVESIRRRRYLFDGDLTREKLDAAEADLRR